MASDPQIKLVERHDNVRRASAQSGDAKRSSAAQSNKNRLLLLVAFVFLLAAGLSYVFLWPSSAESDQPAPLQEGQHPPTQMFAPTGPR